MASVVNCPYKVCDAHIHTASFFRRLNIKFDNADMLCAMSTYSINKALVIPGFTDHMADDSRSLVELASQDDNVYVMVRGVSAAYLEGVLSEKVVGLKINSSQEHRPVGDDYFKEHMQVLSENGDILFAHCGRWQQKSSWLYPAGIALKYPSIVVMLGHMGGTHPDLAMAAADYCKHLPNVYLDLSQCRQPAVLRHAVDTIGSNNILFGSDIPWGSYLSNLAFALDCDLDNYDLRNILHKNFQRVICRK